MALTRDEVEKVSLLARLKLTDAELDRMTAQLGQIVEYVHQLAELDTEEVEPMAHAVELTNVFRTDEVRPSACRVPRRWPTLRKRDEECYLVPAVLGE